MDATQGSSPMELGFESIGNATIICHDTSPILVTDPWLNASAYFGSWVCSHLVPEEQMRSIRACRFAWLSHGHPDHLDAESLKQLSGATLLVPDHKGHRIRDDLRELGFDVRVLPSRQWEPLSERIRVMCIPDYNQDAVLLIDVGGCLLINTNDAGDRGWGSLVRTISRQHPVSFLLKLVGHGDADMINYFDEQGRRQPPIQVRPELVGAAAAKESEAFHARYFVPFSSMHRYQRSDSIWANDYTTDISEYQNGFESRSAEILPAFIRYDVLRDQVAEIDPPRTQPRICDPTEFDDDWAEPLEEEDVAKLNAYFQSIEHLADRFDSIGFRVGGRDHVIPLAKKGFRRGITFEVPRASLMTSLEYHVFDDLLIGNFMKTTLHGDVQSLYPDFSPYVAKYADNAKVRTKHELREYFRHYRQQDPIGYFRHVIESTGRRRVAATLDRESRVYKALARSYHFVRARR